MSHISLGCGFIDIHIFLMICSAQERLAGQLGGKGEAILHMSAS